ncbi:histidine phosphatase family protein [Pseudorhodoferax sp. Leaf274]|uniref:histidine phosphatase family protein n=1 Tax=Pseudorhodoferax sp. Leaf274 TaxID=1736318 RepID=UPI0007025B43|nr:histidine phosphatase family protein [Pseudorhodoferax sp. Leaf274]KQP47647.1 phosphoglycerate mutase [Pseudorhodoferax sp. Leaf274]
MHRRHLTAAAIALACTVALPALAQAPPWPALGPDGIVLFRHADAPGTGDPPQFRLGDCGTQRNLGERGRVQAQELGARFRARNIAVGQVLVSQWCRTRDTAELAFPGRMQEAPAFNSFFNEDAAQSARQTEAARAVLAGWRGPGVLVVVTHQVNITALTGIFPASGEGIVVRSLPARGLEVVGRLPP